MLLLCLKLAAFAFRNHTTDPYLAPRVSKFFKEDSINISVWSTR